jgi:hypothetical protein
MPSDYKPITRPFENKGVVQKVASEFLTEGQWYDQLNAVSISEGNIQSRYGSTRLSPQIASLIHTMELFRLGNSAAEQYLYVGEGNDIYRARMDGLGAFTNLSAGLSAWGQRWTGVKFNAGLSARSYFFIASSKMLKDSAVTPAGAATTGFQNWGLFPPPGALSAAVGSEVALAIYATPATITWTAVPDESGSFKGTLGLNTAINLATSPVNLSQFSSTVKSGRASDGFDSDDYIELKFTPANPSRFSQWILQFDASAGGGQYIDYYEKTIVPNQMSGAFSGVEDPLEAYTERSNLLNIGAVGRGQSSLAVMTADDGTVSYQAVSADTVSDGSRPIELPPSRIADGGTPPEITVLARKRDFLKVGGAGQSGKTWADVKHIRLWAKSATVGVSDLTMAVASVRMVGGSGPNNASPGLAPYEWAYTYRNDATAHESNPCPLMIEDRFLKDVLRRSVALTGFIASSDPQVSSYAIYRRGGTLLNYHFVGYAATGASSFTDTLADIDIMDGRALEFDNDPPVRSSLPTSLMATISGPISTGLQSVAMTVSQPAGVSADTFLTPGSRLLLQDAEKTEYIQVVSISGNTITADFQQAHSGTFSVSTSTAIGVPCRLSAVIGSHIALAGDRNNPHKVYLSKAGRPESFPTIVASTGNANEVNVGTPSNPIMALAEGGGELVTLNRHNLFVVRIFRGQAQQPIETPAQGGLRSRAPCPISDTSSSLVSRTRCSSLAGTRAALP